MIEASVPDEDLLYGRRPASGNRSGLSGGGRESQARLAVLPLENFLPRRRVSQNLDKNPGSYCNRTSYFDLQQNSAEDLQMNFGCGSAIWPLSRTARHHEPSHRRVWRLLWKDYLCRHCQRRTALYIHGQIMSIIPGVAGRLHQTDRGRCCPGPWTLLWYGPDGSVQRSGADSHLGHVFNDGPRESGGHRCASTRQLLDSFPTMNWKTGIGGIGSSLSKNNQKSIQRGI